MNTELATRPDVRVAPIAHSFDEMMRVAETLLKSGFLPQSIKTPAQAVSIILMGREVGLPEMQSLRSINVIQGKPTLSAELMLALFSARVDGKSKIVQSNDASCTITFERPGRPPHTQTFTIEQAERLNLAGKDNYSKQPATMLQWRCVSAGLRFYAPDAIAGISYTPDELGAAVNYETGEVIDLSAAKEIPEVDPPAVDDVPAVDVRADAEMVDFAEELFSSPISGPPRGESGAPPAVLFIAPPEPTGHKDWAFLREMKRQKDRLAKEMGKEKGEAMYYRVLGAAGYSHADEILDRETKIAVFKELSGRQVIT